MSPRLRKFLLTAHLATSIGWFGAVAAFVALAIVGRTSHDAELVRAVYLSMKMAALFVIVPFSLLALLTGVIQGLCTPWGLTRHYWVLAKLVLTLAASFLLVVHVEPVIFLSNAAAKGTLANYGWMRVQILAYACGGLAVLASAMVLAVYKPRGVTGYGVSLQQPEPREARESLVQDLGEARESPAQDTRARDG
jgi:hypothetical protein